MLTSAALRGRLGTREDILRDDGDADLPGAALEELDEYRCSGRKGTPRGSWTQTQSEFHAPRLN